MKNCIFCQIVRGERKADIVYEDEQALAFKDIHPQARIHLLIIPKKHISSLQEMKKEDEGLIGHLVFVAKKIAEAKGLRGYHLVFNVGSEGGQMVFHIHLHLLSADAKLRL